MTPILTHALSVGLPKESGQQRRTRPSVQKIPRGMKISEGKHLPLQITVVNSLSTKLVPFLRHIELPERERC